MEIKFDEKQIEMLQQQISQLILNEVSKIDNNKPRYMNKKQTCSYLQISNNTLDYWIKKGLPVIRINGVMRFDSLEIDNWLSTKYNRVTPLTRKQRSF
ncbi:helix-turn-helix domain-containing protein [Enterococcus sp. AZ192]|uniref:helix-turn-helix domain-containing protein n=1 Tax=unclassified Enterococcus TaxID=2608891 RepID=UPI003D27D242